mmetsp:Transcript_78045/g.180999  ORF Transcript_78045/g.180999 Transcript_78045/m.180999 type:complete len:400 (-) Transcript_78045:198-1397(-)
MSGQGKEKLLAYISHIQDKIRGIEESGEPLEEAQARKVVASVVNSVRSLSACAPGEVRSKIKDALATAGCLDGAAANPSAGLGELSAGVDAVAQVFEGHGGDTAGDTHGDALAAAPAVACPEPGDETETLVGVVNRLWQLEEHFRMKPGSDIHMNVQRRGAAGSAGSGVISDNAREPLFSKVDTSNFNKLDMAFLALLDNYIRDSSKREHVDNVEREEMDRFMELLAGSPHMQYVHQVLVKWDLAPAKFSTFMAHVYDAWFTNYYGSSSSGFEHVFVGEEKYNKQTSSHEVIGLHNWIQFYREEKKGSINYLGYAHKGPEDGCMISVTFAFEDDDAVKPVSTFLVGTTIAFDFALATLVFFGGKDGDKPWVSIGGHDCTIQLYKTTNRLGTYVRSVYID